MDAFGEILEAYSNCRPLSEPERRFLMDKQVHPDALLFSPEQKQFKVLAGIIKWEGEQWFDFVPAEGTRAAIFVCRDQFGQIADLCAWSPKEGRTALWRGGVACLGEERVHLPRTASDVLWAYPSPLEWLQYRRAGIVVLSPERARPILAGSTIAVHAKEVRDALAAAWRAPRVVVREAGVAETVLGAV